MSAQGIVKIGGIGFLVLMFFFSILGCFYTIDQGNRGVVLCNGRMCGEADAGLHFKLPWVQDVKEMDFRTKKFSFTLSTPTIDKQIATIDMVVQWKPTNASRIYSDLKTVDTVADQIIRPKTQEILGAEIGKVDSTRVINDRDTISTTIQNALMRSVARSGEAVVTSALVTHIQLPQAYMDQVNLTLQAQVSVQTAKAQYEQRKITADTKAYEQVTAARADGDSMKLKGIGEAAAISAKNEALKNSPDIVKYTLAQSWDGHLPTTMVPGNSVPFIDVGGK